MADHIQVTQYGSHSAVGRAEMKLVKMEKVFLILIKLVVMFLDSTASPFLSELHGRRRDRHEEPSTDHSLPIALAAAS